MTTEDETPPKRQLWVVEWARSESFWRDVASRAIAGTIVIAIGAAFAVLIGLIDWQVALRAAAFLAVPLGVLGVVIILLRFLVTFVSERTGPRGWRIFERITTGVGLAAIALGVVVLIIYIVNTNIAANTL